MISDFHSPAYAMIVRVQITRNGKIEYSWALSVVSETASLKEIFDGIKSGKHLIIFWFIGQLHSCAMPGRDRSERRRR